MNIIHFCRKERGDDVNIKQHRKKERISQDELAQMISVDRSAIAKWETGKAMPRADKLPEIAKALKCSVDELLGTR